LQDGNQLRFFDCPLFRVNLPIFVKQLAGDLPDRWQLDPVPS